MRRLQPQQAAADDHGMAALLRRRQHLVDVIEIAEGDHALQILARHRDDEGIGTGGDQQAVIGFDATGLGRHRLGLAVDRNDAVARHQRDAIVGVPCRIVDDDIVEGLLARARARA
jgi:hypothetical protein